MGSLVSDKKTQASRALARKQRTLNKILYWVNDGDLYHEKEDSSVRPPGLPTANYIEDRRLKRILFELGKKRQQFLEHAEYEKQQFIEGQRRKSKELRRLLSSGSASRGWSAGETNLTREETELFMADETGVIPTNSGHKRMQVRLGLMTQNNEKQPSSVNDDFKERTLDKDKPKHVQFISTPMPVQNKPFLERLPSIIKEMGRSRSSISVTLPWDKMKTTAMEPENRLPPLLSDPRFRKLEKHLNPLHKNERMDIAVTKVISNMEALHIPPKTKRMSRSLKEQMIKRFLSEQGFAF